MYLAIVTVIMEIIMEMIVMFMNKDNKIIIAIFQSKETKNESE